MFTLGHSTLPIDVFLKALSTNEVELLVDVRTVPKSRHNPQFAQVELSASLQGAGIEYRWMQALGGLRRPHKDSINTGWRNQSFRGYADYMQTPEFAAALDRLMEHAAEKQTAILCAEAVPWRCHRSLVADAMLVRGHVVDDIFVNAKGESSRRPHALTSFARVEDGHLWYPADSPQAELPLG